MTALEELRLALGTATSKPDGYFNVREWAAVFGLEDRQTMRRLKALVDEKAAELAYWRPPGRAREAVYQIKGLDSTPESPAGEPRDRPSAPACTRAGSTARRSSTGSRGLRGSPLRARPS